MSVVIAEGLGKSFAAPDGKRLQALRQVSLTAPKGKLTALVGPDGAGKTTLLRMCAGLMQPDTGSLFVLGEDVSTNPQAVQDRISYMPQRFGLYEDLSVQENLDLYADLHGVSPQARQERFPRLLAMADLSSFTTRPAGKLSGGMKQKLGLIATLARSPDLLLLDEPSVGVDPLSRRELWKILQQLVEDERLSVLVSTAYMDEAERAARVFVLHQGALLAEGEPAGLRELASSLTFTARPTAGESSRALQSRLADNPELIVDATPKGGEVHFIRSPHASPEALQELLAKTSYQSRPESLEDAFMLLLRERDPADGDCSGALSPGSDLRLQCAAPEGEGRRDESSVIVVRDLTRQFGDFTAVANASFAVKRGEIFGLLGPNGAGKTTTFRMLCGLLPASSGQLEVAGVNLRFARREARGRIGYMAQKFSLYGNLSVRENLEFFGAAYGLSGRVLRQQVDEAIAKFGLTENSKSGELPAGYKQRLAMAASLLHRPDILFLDEPTSGIDPLARRAFWRSITAMADAGITVVITTHFMEEAEYCDRIAIQDAGEMLALGTPAEVRAQAGEGNSADMDSAFIAIIEQARRQRAGASA